MCKCLWGAMWRRYLDALVGLRDSPFLMRCKRITRLRLQAELYSLTQVCEGLHSLLPLGLSWPVLSAAFHRLCHMNANFWMLW